MFSISICLHKKKVKHIVVYFDGMSTLFPDPISLILNLCMVSLLSELDADVYALGVILWVRPDASNEKCFQKYTARCLRK